MAREIFFNCFFPLGASGRAESFLNPGRAAFHREAMAQKENFHGHKIIRSWPARKAPKM